MRMPARLARSVAAALRASVRYGAHDLFSLVLDALGRYKLRTALSILGIVLGIAAVIAMLSVGEGARAETLRQVEALGLDNIIVRAKVSSQVPTGQAGTGLTLADAARISRLVPLAVEVAPLVQRFVPMTGPAASRSDLVLGVTREYRDVLDLQVTHGRFLSATDDQPGARVCVLGPAVARALFGYRDPVDQPVRLGKEWYEVIGVLAARSAVGHEVGNMPLRDLNTAVLVPLPALLGHPVTVDRSLRVDEIWVRVADGRLVDDIGAVVQHTLAREKRGAGDAEVIVPRALLEQSLRVQRTFSVVIGSIAMIALLVGGIGIMNIMLASVLERTQEIGLRRAVGASRRDVIVQFLTESLALTVAGGLLGILLGVAVSWTITAYAGWQTSVSLWAIVVAVLVSGAVGLVFGSYPAARAASLQPIEAVRYE